MNDRTRTAEALSGALGLSAAAAEPMHAIGVYTAICCDADGNELWRDEYTNLVTTAGKNDMLDKYLAGSAYTAAWYLGIISSASYSAIAAADTMASHTGWLEAGATNAPAYSETARRTAAWSAAASGSKALSAALVFTFTSSGTVKGSFLSSVATKDGTTGTLFSAGLFTAGDQPVVATNTLSVSYSATLT